MHGIGRLGVSNSIWDRPGPLSTGEWELVRISPHLTERMLYQSAALAPLDEIAVQYRERLDGGGYPRGLSGGAMSRPAERLVITPTITMTGTMSYRGDPNRCSSALRPGTSTPSRTAAITLSSSASSQSNRDDHSTYV